MRIYKKVYTPKKPSLWLLIILVGKTNYQSYHHFYLDHTRIKQVHKTKYLGLTVDDKLCWDEHYESVKEKVIGGLASIRKLKNILSQSQLLNVYQALV